MKNIKLILLLVVAVWVFVCIKWPYVGAGLLVVLVVAVYGTVWYFKRKLKGMLSAFGEANFGVQNVTLVPRAKIQWRAPDDFEANRSALAALGFEDIGCFAIEESGELSLFGMLHKGVGAHAVIYDSDGFTGVDLASRYGDGSSFTCSSTDVIQLHRPPGHQALRHPNLPVAELYDIFMRERPDKEALPVTSDEFAPMVEDFVKDQNEYLLKIYEKNDDLEETLIKKYLEQESPTALVWEEQEDRVTFIHDNLPPTEVVTTFTYQADSLTEEEIERLDEATKPIVQQRTPRAIFQYMNEELLDKPLFEKLAVLTDPIETDVYLGPEDPDDDDDEEYDDDDYDEDDD